jgi:NTE family protein
MLPFRRRWAAEPEVECGLPATHGTAFVLSGGANLGAAQVGALLALLDVGIAPDVVVGCSVGALNATYLAAEPTLPQVESLADVWRSLSVDNVFDTRKIKAIANVVRRQDHLFEADPLRALIRRLAPVTDLAHTLVPVHVVATDLGLGTATWFTSGRPEDVLAASAALPGLLPPVELDGHVYVDGGVLEPVPVRKALSLGCRTIYVLDVSCGSRSTGSRAAVRPRSALDVLVRSFEVARMSNTPDPATLGTPDQQVIVVPTADTSGLDIRDFTQSARLIEESREIAARFLDRTRGATAA